MPPKSKIRRVCRLCNGSIRSDNLVGICVANARCRLARAKVYNAGRKKDYDRQHRIGYLRVKIVSEDIDVYRVSIYTGTDFEPVADFPTLKEADDATGKLRAALRDAILCHRALRP